MICRHGEYFVPRGNTSLEVGDKLLVVSDLGDKELQKVYDTLGIKDVVKLQ